MLYGGLAAEYTRIWETLPGSDWRVPAAPRTESGWGLGFRLLAAPEWEFGSRRWAVGSEFSFDPFLEYFGSGQESRHVDLFRSAVHVHLARRI